MTDEQHASGMPQPGSRPAGGPDAADPAYKQLEAQRRHLHEQGDMQATAETEDPHTAVSERTGNARRAEEAAGGEIINLNARDDADAAFQASRGNHEPRERPTERS